jgi:hypothetical protein
LIKVVIIIPFFGKKFPDYFRLYIKSAAFNRKIDFMFFTDIKTEEQLPSNLIMNVLSIDEFNKLTSKITGVNPCIQSEYCYKLCDLKPMYGKIFQDYILDYDYWGWGDIDLIYGNVEDFLHKKIKEGFDIISLRKKWMSGATCLFRNSTETNDLYLLSDDWQKVLSNPNKYYGFDEVSKTHDCEFLFPRLEKGEEMDSFKTEIDSFTSVVNKNKNKIKTHFEDVICEKVSVNMLLKFYHGDIYVYKKGMGNHKTNTSFVAFHYVNEKGAKRFLFPDWEKIPDEFIVSRYGFYKLDKNLLKAIFWRKIVLISVVYPIQIAKGLMKFVRKRFTISYLLFIIKRLIGKCGEIIYHINKPTYFWLKRILK